MSPIPLVEGPGVKRGQSISQNLFVLNGQLYTVSYDYNPDKKEEYEEFVCYDIGQQKMQKANNDTPNYFADLQDGYIYYCSSHDLIDNSKWYRVKPDGSDWEDLTWMMEPTSPKKIDIATSQQ